MDEFVRRARAPIEHLFDCHEWCDKEWCWAKELDDAQHKVVISNMQKNVEEDLPTFSSSSSEDGGSESDSHQSDADTPRLSTRDEYDSDEDEWSDNEAGESQTAQQWGV